MEIHTYRAASLQEALLLVRHELGPEASVLQTREITGRFFGLLGRPSVEVHASRDAKATRRLSSAREDQSSHAVEHRTRPATTADDFGHLDMTEPATDNHSAMMAQHYSAASSIPPSKSATSSASSPYSATGPATISSAPHAHVKTPSSPSPQLSPAMFEVFTEMLDADVDPEAARTMLQEVASHCSPEQLSDGWLIKGRLCQLIQQRIHISGPLELSGGERHVVALVGPTGVGKTTTLAKLAAGFHFDQGISVGFITLDTFRLGAVDQLQKYADLLGAPCEIVSAPDQMVDAMARLAHCQLILIDTAGRSPRDEAQLDALHVYLQVAQPTQIHLVLSAASSQSHAQMALEQFSVLNPTHLLLTKLDEATCLGSWYRLLSSGTWPLSYLTTGQHVPEDILVANRRRVASLILGQTNHLAWK